MGVGEAQANNWGKLVLYSVLEQGTLAHPQVDIS